MPHPRRTAASLLLALTLTLLLPGGAHALPPEAAPEAAGEPAGTASTAPAALTAAWDWLRSLAEPQREDPDGTRTEAKLPGCLEGSHLDPNGGPR